MNIIDNIKERVAKIPVQDAGDLLLCKMTHEEAKAFAGEHGMNAVVVDKNDTMQLARIDKHLHFTYNTSYGPTTRPLTDEHTIYWIGAKR